MVIGKFCPNSKKLGGFSLCLPEFCTYPESLPMLLSAKTFFVASASGVLLSRGESVADKSRELVLGFPIQFDSEDIDINIYIYISKLFGHRHGTESQARIKKPGTEFSLARHGKARNGLTWHGSGLPPEGYHQRVTTRRLRVQQPQARGTDAVLWHD